MGQQNRIVHPFPDLAPAGHKASAPFPPPARSARWKGRHVFVVASFLLWVCAPTALIGRYMAAVAQNQYASHVGFSVQKDATPSPQDLLGGLAAISGSASSDTDILYEFIQSPEMVARANRRLDLATIFNNPKDPVFSLGDDTRIEALTAHWNRVVRIDYDRSGNLLELRTLAFSAPDAQTLAQVIFDESSDMINAISAISREDAIRHARTDRAHALERLKEARTALSNFQNRTHILNPLIELQNQANLLGNLKAQLTEASVRLEMLSLNKTSRRDPRTDQARKEIQTLKTLIQKEQQAFMTVAHGQPNRPELLAEYETLKVNLEFAEQSFLSAQTVYDTALATAQRKSRYLATYIAPTRAQTPEYPRRARITALTFGTLLLLWAIFIMAYYAVRDRR